MNLDPGEELMVVLCVLIISITIYNIFRLVCNVTPRRRNSDKES